MIKADLLKKTSERVCNQQAPRCFFSQILQNMWALKGKILVSSGHVCNHHTPGGFFSRISRTYGLSSATTCQIGLRLIKIGPNPDRFLGPIRTKSRPNPDLNVPWIRTNTMKLDFHQTSLKLLEFFCFANYLLHRWIHNEKDRFSALIHPIFIKSGLFYAKPDHFRTNFMKKVQIRTKVRKKRSKWEHCISVNVSHRK